MAKRTQLRGRSRFSQNEPKFGSRLPFWQNEPNDGDRFDQFPADASACHNSKASASSKGFFVACSHDIVSTHGTNTKLNAAFKTGDRKVICAAIFAEIVGIGNVSAFALKAGVDRTMLYRGG